MSILVTLELQGYIREITKNYYIRINRSSSFMAHYLVIVESPAKVKTIKSF